MNFETYLPPGMSIGDLIVVAASLSSLSVLVLVWYAFVPADKGTKRARLLAELDLHEKELGELVDADGNESVYVLALGRVGTGMPLHHHGAAWLELVAGSKLWLFYEPSACVDFNTRRGCSSHRRSGKRSTRQL